MAAVDAGAELALWLAEELDAAAGLAAMTDRYKFQVAADLTVATGERPVNSVGYQVIIWRANPNIGQPPIMVGYGFVLPPNRVGIAAIARDAVAKISAVYQGLLAVPANGHGG